MPSAASAAEHLGCTLSFHHVQHSDDLTPVLARAKKGGATGIIVAPDALTYLYRTKLVEAASKNRLPGIYWSREFAEVGGLMTYGANIRELGRHAAIFVDKILRGAKPADLPVEQPTAFDLVINLKTAKALGLAIPPSLLARADQLID
jgi:putative tryptophan/tyrosine transport system substrate-binding protein